MSPIRTSSLLVLGLIVTCANARAGFIGDTVSVVMEVEQTVEFSASAVVVSPDLEFNDFVSRWDINVEDSSIDILVTSGFGFGTGSFAGLRFSSLDGGSAITGFTLNVSGSLVNFFGSDRISFGPDRLDVDFDTKNIGGVGIAAGDRVTIDLQFAPTAVPEPVSLAMAGVGLIGIAGLPVRRRRVAA